MPPSVTYSSVAERARVLRGACIHVGEMVAGVVGLPYGCDVDELTSEGRPTGRGAHQFAACVEHVRTIICQSRELLDLLQRVSDETSVIHRVHDAISGLVTKLETAHASRCMPLVLRWLNDLIQLLFAEFPCRDARL